MRVKEGIAKKIRYKEKTTRQYTNETKTEDQMYFVYLAPVLDKIELIREETKSMGKYVPEKKPKPSHPYEREGFVWQWQLRVLNIAR